MENSALEPRQFPSEPLEKQSLSSTQALKDKVAALKLGSNTDLDGPRVAAQNSHQRSEPRELTPEEQSLPIVIPQATRKRNAFDSPFVRCYAESLRYKGIPQETFLAFLDGLNECFISNPAVQPISIAGAVMQQFYGLSTVQYVGAGVQAAAGLVGAAVSYGRTKAYMKAINVDLFHPVGLSATILKAKKMTEKIGYGTEKIAVTVDLDSAPIEEEVKAGMISNVSFESRMKALEGHVAELSLDVPESERPDNLLKRMGAAQANRASKKQNKRSDKKLAKAKEKAEKVDRKVEKLERKMEKKIDKLERENGHSDKTIKEMEKVIREGEAKIQEEEAKGNKHLKKIEKRESKSANKMRWIVIMPWDGDDDSDAEEEEAELSSDNES